MDPRNLVLINFMSHAHTVVPFHLLSAACIQGANGAGKSSIVDGILFALYGETSRGKDDIVKIGETEMTVVFEFEQAGKLYKIMRKRSIVGRGKSVVELYQYNGGTPPFDWNPLAIGEEAKEKILEIIGRDYSTFTSTSFLLQGQGEKLINAKATERYKVVFDILGLARYEEYRAQAVKKKNKLIGQRETLLRVLGDLKGKALKIGEFKRLKEENERKLTDARRLLSEKETALSEKSSEAAIMQSRIKEMEGVKKELGNLEREKLTLDSRVKELYRGLKSLPLDIEPRVLTLLSETTLEEALARSAGISAQIEALKNVEAEIRSLGKREADLVTRKQEVEAYIANQRKTLDNKEKILHLAEEEKVKTEALSSLKTELENLEKEAEDYNGKLKRCSELATEIAKLHGIISVKEKEREHALRTAERDLNDAMKEAALLPVTACKGEGEYASCVLLKKAMESKSSIPSIKARVEELSRPFEIDERRRLEPLLAEKASLDENSLRKALLESRAHIARAKDSIRALESRLATIKTWTEKASQISSAEDEIKRVEAQMADLARDITDIGIGVKVLNERKASRETLLRELEMLDRVVERLRVDSESKVLKAQVEAVTKSITEVRKKIESCESLEKSLLTLQRETGTLKTEVELIKGEEKGFFSESLRFDSEIRGCLQAEEDAKTKEAETEGLVNKIRVIELLEDAYEKIPFYILDNVIEIMEEEANNILEEISATGMRIELRTEKANKNGKGAKDALDIIVSDIAGERRIELYSGGEKTRQILALAVGLAELSARKAGVKIETLLIDEPSGLDAQGLADFGRCFIKLVESGMFKKGLLMAHEEILKDIFEQKVIVSKNGTTSQVEVLA